MALTGSGDFVFDWNIERDRVAVSDELGIRLGERRGALRGSIKRWLDRVHPEDRDRSGDAALFRPGASLLETDLQAVQERSGAAEGKQAGTTFFDIDNQIGKSGIVARKIAATRASTCSGR